MYNNAEIAFTAHFFFIDFVTSIISERYKAVDLKDVKIVIYFSCIRVSSIEQKSDAMGRVTRP